MLIYISLFIAYYLVLNFSYCFFIESHNDIVSMVCSACLGYPARRPLELIILIKLINKLNLLLDKPLRPRFSKF